MTDIPPTNEFEPEPDLAPEPDPEPAEDSEPAGPAAGPQPPLQYGPPPVRRLYRSRHDRKVGGVSAGVAEYFKVDPTIVRLATLVFAFTGVGFFAYIAAWIIIPERPDGYPESQRPGSGPQDRTMTAAFGIAALALAFGIITGSWEVLAIALIGGGIWLLSERTPALASPSYNPDQGAYPTSYPAAPVAFAPTDYGYQPAASPGGDVPPGPTWTDPDHIAPAPKERKPQRITWLVLSLLALLIAVGVAAAAGDWWDVSGVRFLGIGVVIIGAGVVAGQVRGGGARGLIPLGILSALMLFPVSAVDGLVDDGVGQSVYRPLTIQDLEPSYQHGIGQLTVDLSELDFEGRTETIDIDLGIGELIVIVPDDAGGSAVLQATAGEVSHFLPRTNSYLFDEGVNIETGTVRLEGETGQLDLNISVGLGTAELQSEPSE